MKSKASHPAVFPEDGGGTFLRVVGKFIEDYTMSLIPFLKNC
jgi:hypothetical protein